MEEVSVPSRGLSYLKPDGSTHISKTTVSVPSRGLSYLKIHLLFMN